MPRGPLPHAQRRRRNAPAISTRQLPASGRKGRAPAVPAAYNLGKAGRAWWSWAWKLPQATAWDKGSLYAIARRAQLEDDLAALGTVETLDLSELLGIEENEAARTLDWLIGHMKRLTGGEISVMKEMRELDKRLGIDPKALAELRWEIVDEPEKQSPPKKARRSSGRRAAAVDPKDA